MSASEQGGPGGAGPRSRRLNEAARRLFPGGVSSPVRAFKSVGGEPPVVRSISVASSLPNHAPPT